MTDGPSNPLPGVPASLVDRAKNIIVQPKTEWPRIEAEPATVGGIYTSYVMILAAIPAIASLIGLLLFMPRAPEAAVAIGQALGVPMISTTSIIVGAVVQYALSLASVYIMGLIIDGIAPSFGGTKDPLKAFKVAAYFPTASWIAGILMLFPALAPIALLAGLYSLYLLYVGLPILMKVPEDKLVVYFIVVLVLAIIVLGLVNVIASRVTYGGMF